MKLKTTLLFLFCCILLSYSQKTTAFQQFKSEIQLQKRSRDFKVKRAIAFVSSNRLYVSELITVCNYFQKEKSKYKISLNAYKNIIDKRNFFEVYNVFNSFSTAIQLYHNTQARNKIKTEVEVIQYPTFYNYKGALNSHCQQPISEYDFNRIKNSVINIQNEAIKNEQLKRVMQNNCFTTQQVMQLTALFTTSNSRFNFLRGVVSYTIDLENLFYTKQLIKGTYEKQRLHDFINEQIVLLTSEINDCRTLSTNEFTYVLQTIKDQSFSKDKKKITKQQLAKNCFNIQQLKTIVEQFSFDKDRLEILKYGYQYVDEASTFYTLRVLLKFRSYKKEFDEFLLQQN